MRRRHSGRSFMKWNVGRCRGMQQPLSGPSGAGTDSETAGRQSGVPVCVRGDRPTARRAEGRLQPGISALEADEAD